MNLTNNRMKLGIAMMLIASLSAALMVIPSKVAIAQTSPQNQTMSGNQTTSGTLKKFTRVVIPIDLPQLRDQVRSQHPLLAAIADKIQTMDAKDTLKYTIGVDIVADMLKLHARQLMNNQTAGNQTAGNQTSTP
ncbi:MAG TPA: hypothetical protein VE089_00850 [Nitrososphaeraceae archaeon]|nr:hypothetical protein [Nitrososphaeraceae archaeon]